MPIDFFCRCGIIDLSKEREGNKMRRTNESIYKAEINTNGDYKVSKAAFICWLTQNGVDIKTSLYGISSETDCYDVAVDFSIPLILVKALMKEYL